MSTAQSTHTGTELQEEPPTAGERLIAVLEALGFPTRTGVVWDDDSTVVIVMLLDSDAEVWISATNTGQTDHAPEDHSGWVAHCRPFGDTGGWEEEPVHEAEEGADFVSDTIALAAAVAAWAARQSAPSAEESVARPTA